MSNLKKAFTQEIYKPIPGYPAYEISNLGNVKSFKKENPIILKARLNVKGYYYVNLRENNIPKSFDIHQLIAISFLGHVRCGFKFVVDHIDGNKLNNHINNLKIITNRENVTKGYLKINTSSRYTGVCWAKGQNKWKAAIKVNGKRNHLGYFVNEIDAHLAYQNKLKSIL